MDEIVRVLKSMENGDELIYGIKNGDRSIISKAIITLLSLDNQIIQLATLTQKIKVFTVFSSSITSYFSYFYFSQSSLGYIDATFGVEDLNINKELTYTHFNKCIEITNQLYNSSG